MQIAHRLNPATYSRDDRTADCSQCGNVVTVAPMVIGKPISFDMRKCPNDRETGGVTNA